MKGVWFSIAKNTRNRSSLLNAHELQVPTTEVDATVGTSDEDAACMAAMIGVKSMDTRRLERKNGYGYIH